MRKSWLAVLRAGKKKKANGLQEQRPDKAEPRESNDEIQYGTPNDGVQFTDQTSVSFPNRRSDPPPRIELPIDFRSSPFSKATYSPPGVSSMPRLRRKTAMKNLSEESFRLLDLPTELRLQILKQHFGNKTVALDLIGTSLATDTNLARKNYYCLSARERQLNKTAILRTCHQLYEEGHEVLSSCTAFIIRIGGPGIPRLLTPSDKFTIPLQNLRHVVLNVSIMSPELEPGLQSALLSFTSLQTADLHFDFASFNDQLCVGEWILETFVKAFKTERLNRISCVKLQREKIDSHPWFRIGRTLVPHTSPALEALKEKWNV